jgi:tetratricopeptide (TPR) repeat protein
MVRKYSQAEKLYESAIATAPRTSSEDRIRAATIEANLAELYELNGKLSRAAAAYQHSLDVLENELSSEHAAVKELKQLIQQFVLRHGIR